MISKISVSCVYDTVSCTHSIHTMEYNGVESDRIEYSMAGRGGAGQGQGRARAEQGRAEQGRAGPSVGADGACGARPRRARGGRRPPRAEGRRRGASRTPGRVLR